MSLSYAATSDIHRGLPDRRSCQDSKANWTRRRIQLWRPSLGNCLALNNGSTTTRPRWYSRCHKAFRAKQGNDHLAPQRMQQVPHKQQLPPALCPKNSDRIECEWHGRVMNRKEKAPQKVLLTNPMRC